jgi:RNA polymerase sigma-70 factor, ECF subfamily
MESRLPEAGAIASVAELYAEHAKFVWRNLQRLGIPPDHIEDAVQDVFLAAQQALRDFEGRSSVRTWLFAIMARIAARRCERIRVKNQRFRPLSPELLDTLVESGHGPLDLLLQRQAIELGHRLLSELDYDKRTILVMVELEQMSVVEAAEALDINLNTAHSRLRAGRRLLAERLRESLAEPKVAS